MKKRELKVLGVDQMKQRIIDTRTELSKEKASIASGTRPENPGKIRNMKRSIAMLKTYIRQEELGIREEKRKTEKKEKTGKKAKKGKEEKKENKEKKKQEPKKEKKEKERTGKPVGKKLRLPKKKVKEVKK